MEDTSQLRQAVLTWLEQAPNLPSIPQAITDVALATRPQFEAVINAVADAAPKSEHPDLYGKTDGDWLPRWSTLLGGSGLGDATRLVAQGAKVPVEEVADSFVAFCTAPAPLAEDWLLLRGDVPDGTRIPLGNYTLQAFTADELRQLDAALGDGDLGITVSGGATAIGEAIYPLPADAHPADVLAVAGTAFATANPSTFAALVGSGLLAASGSLATATQFTRAEIAEAGQAFLEQVKQRGGAELGDKTFVDVLAPVVDAILTGGTEAEISTRCVEVAHSAVEQGAQRVSKRGRASWIGERSRGHRDPGSVALLRVIEEIANVVEAP
jgi:hypothetical protein